VNAAVRALFDKIRRKQPNGFDHAITAVVVFSGILVGLQTDEGMMGAHATLLEALDDVVVAIFTAELLFKFALEGARPWRYFLNHDHDDVGHARRFFDLDRIDFWHAFDFAIVVMCLAPHLLPMHLHTQFLPFLRLVRILRVLRVAEDIQRLNVLVRSLLKSLPSIAYICLFMCMHFYVYAAIGSTMFAKEDPAHFGSIAATTLSLFEVVTGNGFSQLMHDAIDRAPQFDYAPWAPVVYFASFVVVAVMVILNLFVGVITSEMTALKNALIEEAHEQREVEIEEHELEILQHVETLESQLESIRDTLAKVKQSRAVVDKTLRS
jgi:voltage-gated sodium channel